MSKGLESRILLNFIRSPLVKYVILESLIKRPFLEYVILECFCTVLFSEYVILECFGSETSCMLFLAVKNHVFAYGLQRR